MSVNDSILRSQTSAMLLGVRAQLDALAAYTAAVLAGQECEPVRDDLVCIQLLVANCREDVEDIMEALALPPVIPDNDG